MKKVIRYAISFYTIICLLIGLISCKQINNEKSSESDQQLIYIGEDIAVAPTTYGKVRGFIMRDIYHFRGIPYGASTERGNRFMPPQEPKPWKNIRPTVAFGASAPQTMYNQQPESYHMFQDHWNAVALSGSTIKASSKQQAQQFGRFLLKEAGLQASQIDSLQHMPWQEYMSIAESASKKMQKSMNLKVSFSPIGDDINIPDSLFFDPKNPNIPDVPMLFCTTFHEWSISRDHPELEGINFAGVTEKLSTTYGVNSKVIVEAYQRQFPEMSPIEIWNLIKANRKNVVRSANRKLVQKSPIYMAWFGWKSPLFDGRQRAFHCIDISFWFYNTDLMITHSGGGKRPRLLSEKMCAALSSFMRTGNPSTPELPQWLPYTEENGETMILDNECKLVNDPDGPAREILVNCEYNQNEQTPRK